MKRRKRNIHLHVMVTQEEHDAISERMAEAGVTNMGLSSLSDIEKEKFYDASKQLTQRWKKTPQWIRTAITHKKLTDWRKHGLGLLFTPHYQIEIDALVEKENREKATLKAEQQRIAREIGAQMNQEPEIVYVGRKDKPRKRDLIDFETLGGMDGEEIQK